MKSAFFAAALMGFSILPAAARPHNIVIFVADGLRYGSVEPGNMPVMARLKAQGVDFADSHSLYPTITTVNASAIATGHGIGDTGDFGNTLYLGRLPAGTGEQPIVFLENDAVLSRMNRLFGGNYLNETTLIAAARQRGWQTAIIGKQGPVRIQDPTAAPDGSQTVIVDDATGRAGGLGLPPWFTAAMKDASMAPQAPKVTEPDTEQENWEMRAATRIVLPRFRQTGKPFVLLFWSRDPDISQHDTRDSIGKYMPGINGPTGLAGTHDADTQLGALIAYLRKTGLSKTTDLFVTADHGFATVSHASATSPSRMRHDDLPSGFLANDLALALGLPLHVPDGSGPRIDLRKGGTLPYGSGMLGADPRHPKMVVAANGGSDLIYLPAMTTGDLSGAKALAARAVAFLESQDYVSGLFVNDRLGSLPGTLPMSDVGLIGAARTPVPAIYVNFRTFQTGCAHPLQCTVQVSDTPLATGQGHHASFSRATTRNFMAAIGPDFKASYVDRAPVSNADIAPTLAHLMGFALPARGKLTGRVLSEALKGGAPVKAEHHILVSSPGKNGLQTILDEQTVAGTRYFDAAGFKGRTVGLAMH